MYVARIGNAMNKEMTYLLIKLELLNSNVDIKLFSQFAFS